jgi:hypothetical protein
LSRLYYYSPLTEAITNPQSKLYIYVSFLLLSVTFLVSAILNRRITIIYRKFKILINVGHMQTSVYKPSLAVNAMSSSDIELIYRCGCKSLTISLYVGISGYFLLITCISSTVLHVIVSQLVTYAVQSQCYCRNSIACSTPTSSQQFPNKRY